MALPKPNQQPNRYIDDNLAQIQQDFNPTKNKEFEQKCNTKTLKNKKAISSNDNKLVKNDDNNNNKKNSIDMNKIMNKINKHKKWFERFKKKQKEREIKRNKTKQNAINANDINSKKKQIRKRYNLLKKRRQKLKNKTKTKKKNISTTPTTTDNHAADPDPDADIDADKDTDRKTKANPQNTSLLISSFIRKHEFNNNCIIPSDINLVCFMFYYEATNVLFNYYDTEIGNNLIISNKNKMVTIAYKTICVFSNEGYDDGLHEWSIKCHNAYSCQSVGITSKKNAKYRWGFNIFDTALNEQLGDRYVYAGDSGHSWRGSTESRPYICTVNDNKLECLKDFKLDNNTWNIDDVISIKIDFRDKDLWTIIFYKNGEPLCDKISVIKKCIYYPVLQVYQRGTFEIIDDYNIEKAK